MRATDGSECVPDFAARLIAVRHISDVHEPKTKSANKEGNIRNLVSNQTNRKTHPPQNTPAVARAVPHCRRRPAHWLTHRMDDGPVAAIVCAVAVFGFICGYGFAALSSWLGDFQLLGKR